MLGVENIIHECVKGNRFAMQLLYEQYSNKLLGISRRYAGNYDEAKDWMHEGWIRIFENIKNFRAEGTLEGWLCVVMRNTALEMVKKQNRFTYTRFEEFEIEYEDINEGEFEEMMDKFSEEDLLKTLDLLSPQYRMVFNMYVVEGLSHKETAVRLGISESTSKSNLNRARKQLIDILRKHCQNHIDPTKYRNESISKKSNTNTRIIK